MEKKPPLVSVILPVYNPGDYIIQCLNSVRNQTLKEIEIIFIDDCSTDDSIEAVIKAAAEDDRIAVIKNEKNSGAGFSRNIGIEAAKGEYVSFIDPDDYIADTFFELLYKKVETNKPDIVKGECISVDLNGTPSSQGNAVLNTRIRKGLNEGKPLYTLFTYNHWTAIFRREFLLQSGARYGLARNAQDTVFLLRACYFAKTVELEDEAIYYYVAREHSRMGDCSQFRLQQDFISFTDIVSFIREHYDGTTVQLRYLCGIVIYMLRVQAWAKQTRGLEDDADAFLSQLHDAIAELPFADQLASLDTVVREFIYNAANLSTVPYRIQQNNPPPEKNLEVVSRWVDYMVQHPEKTSERSFANRWYQVYWTALSDQRVVKGKVSHEKKKQYYKDLRNLTKKTKDNTFPKNDLIITLVLSSCSFCYIIIPPINKLLSLVFPAVKKKLTG